MRPCTQVYWLSEQQLQLLRYLPKCDYRANRFELVCEFMLKWQTTNANRILSQVSDSWQQSTRAPTYHGCWPVSRIVSTRGTSGKFSTNAIAAVCGGILTIFTRCTQLFGTLDLSPVLALVVLQAFQSSTAALGAELPGANAPVRRAPARGPWCSVLPSICARRN